jgi:hypothetical protein
MDVSMNIKEHAKGLVLLNMMISNNKIIKGRIGPGECKDSFVFKEINGTIM